MTDPYDIYILLFNDVPRVEWGVWRFNSPRKNMNFKF